MKFQFIHDHRTQWPVAVQCEVLGVTRQGYYSWRDRPPSKTALRRAQLTELTEEVYQENLQVYGSPRIHQELLARGHQCDPKTVAKVMKNAGIAAVTVKNRRVSTTDSKDTVAPAKNILDREFSAEKPNEKWLTDITYIPTQEGWLYLAAVEDVYSRKIVGWSMSKTIDSRLVVDALQMAIDKELPAAGLLAHSDRGSQYASDHYQRLLTQHGIVCSMSRKGNCWDNAPMESFFATLKKEWVHRHGYLTCQEARHSIFMYIELFYNRIRRHSALGYLSPENFLKTS